MYVGLTSDQIIKLHDMQIEAYGGLPGIKEPGLLEFLAEKPFSHFYGQEQYPGLFMKAAVYWEGLANGHYFNDANKRTSVMAALVFLDLNGYELSADIDEMFDVAIQVATKAMAVDKLASWLMEYSVRKETG